MCLLGASLEIMDDWVICFGVYISLLLFLPGFVPPVVQQCPDPGEVVNGARSVHPELGFAVGTVVRFTCNQGYQLEGPSQVSCHGRDTGMPKWSDRSPKCVCKCLFFMCFMYFYMRISQCPCVWNYHCFLYMIYNSFLISFSHKCSEVWSMPKSWCARQWLPNSV